jgi:hypothetical protein
MKFRCAFEIKPTSVTDVGLGVYARKTYEPGATLFTYPGKRVSADTFNEINEFLFQLVDNWQTPDASLQILHQKYGVIIYRTTVLIGVPNWRAIYKTFIRFLIANDYGEYMYWTMYDWSSGEIAGTWICTKNPGILINEPPPYDAFFNLQRSCLQKSVTNVRTETREDHEIYFVAKTQIEVGDELLIHYGPFFERDYATSLALCNVQNYSFNPDELDEENLERVKKYEHDIINYESRGPVLNVSETNKRRKSCTDSTS